MKEVNHQGRVCKKKTRDFHKHDFQKSQIKDYEIILFEVEIITK